ncbi:hypothetical protein DFH09DRAFT_1372115 [Mycena vulgaris]|nr:hypothetical protein DFH09DRAFT_1372115 [Mycena vulgaris]
MDAAVPFILIWHSGICAQSVSADALGLLMIVLVSSASGLTRARFPPSQHLPLVPSFLRIARHSPTQGSHGGLLQSQFSRNIKPLFTGHFHSTGLPSVLHPPLLTLAPKNGCLVLPAPARLLQLPPWRIFLRLP